MLGPALGLMPAPPAVGQGVASRPRIQPIVMIGAFNTAGGDDSAGAALDSVLDTPANVLVYVVIADAVGLIDTGLGCDRNCPHRRELRPCDRRGGSVGE